MKEFEETYDLQRTLEQELGEIDEAKLPQVLSERLELLEKTNSAYNDAKKKEEIARRKVGQALDKADELVRNARGAGKNEARTRSFLGIEWTTKGDEIEALKKNLKEIIACGINSAEAQKELVEVQSAMADSQVALLEVQKAQMMYQAKIADATKFLYGLSAYNIASIQSVLINLEAVLSGASKEKLGEMAQQQLFLALDQLKNQENIILRIRENEKLIDQLEIDISLQDEKIENLRKQQDSLIEELQKQDEEQDSLIEELQKQDEEQDNLIEDLQKQDEEQDSLIEDLQKQDEEQDSLIEDLQKQDEEQDNLIEDLQKQDEEQDSLIEDLQKQDEEQDSLIENLQQQDEEQDRLLEEIKHILSKNKEEIKQVEERLVQTEEDMNNRIGELNKKIESLSYITSKKGWKICVTFVAVISLLLNILQILGVF